MSKNLKVGEVIWHSSGEDEGPDVGLELGLGPEGSLYMGEMPDATLRKAGIEGDTGGWWLVLYTDSEALPFARVVGDNARDAFDLIAARVRQGA